MPTTIDRRRIFEAAGFSALTAMTVGLPTAAESQAASSAAPPAVYEVKPLPVDPSKVKGLSEKIITSHYQNNYAGAVKRLNAITAQLGNLDWANAPSFLVNGLKREELIAMNSMILHEHYFNVLGGEGEPGDTLADAIRRDFGSVERWRAEFAAMGKAEGGGSGWVILSYSPRSRRLVNSWASDHTTTLAGGRPLLVLDMYEHAYHMDFGAKAGAYVDAFMRDINWTYPDRLFNLYRKEP